MKLEELRKKLPAGLVFENELLANHTTLRIGGPADLFFRAGTVEQLVEAVVAAREFGVPVTILGGGSNILVSDKGIRGLVIKNETNEIKVGEVLKRSDHFRDQEVGPVHRWQSDNTLGTFKYEFSDLNYDESESPRVRVILDSGVSLQMAITDLLSQGITGLQWFAKIPGTIGGAVFNNIHGGARFFSEFLRRVRVLTPEGKVRWLDKKDLGLVYDRSRFHESGEVILSAEFELFRGDADRAKTTAFEWARRKRIQPPRSAGCTFKNVSNEDKEKLGLPTTSVGYIVEHVLKMGGYKVGGAKVSTAHHSFIVNEGGASAADYLAVMREIQKRARERLGIELESEIILLGEL